MVGGENSGKASTFLPYLVLYFHFNVDSSLPLPPFAKNASFFSDHQTPAASFFSGEFPAAADDGGFSSFVLELR